MLAASVSLLISSPAQAADLLRVPIDADLQHLLAGPDGGAWVSTYAFKRQTLQRVFSDGSVRTASPNAWAGDVTLGPDGQAWFIAGPGVVRVDAAGTASPIAVDGIGRAISTGSDGTAWATASAAEPRWLRIRPDGAVTEVPLAVPGCPAFRGRPLARASDGAMWSFDVTCGFVRFPPDGAPVVLGHRLPWAERLVPASPAGCGSPAISSPEAATSTLPGASRRCAGSPAEPSTSRSPQTAAPGSLRAPAPSCERRRTAPSPAHEPRFPPGRSNPTRPAGSTRPAACVCST